MLVRLLRYTIVPNEVVAQSMMGCQSKKAAYELHPDIDKQKEMIALAIQKGHESVLEHAVFTFSVNGISRACSHQLVRHRIASYSQQSQRHVDPTKDPEWFVTPRTIEAEGLKMPGIDPLWANQAFRMFMSKAADLYGQLIAIGVPEEDARFVLPNACKTNIVITMNARELRHFFKLRRSTEAQWEIRRLANHMFALAKAVSPELFIT